ncbi:MAG TPA: hypothetical protein VIX59_09075 [Candidatus Binataceae bacterium]
MATRKRSALSRKISELYQPQHAAKASRRSGPSAPLELRKKELKALADVNLGEGYDPRKLEEVARLQARLHARQQELAAHLKSKEISPEQYLNALSALHAEIFSECEKVLGPRDFHALFGTGADQVGTMIDRQAFRKAHPH